jgi:cell division protein FtsN
MEQKKTLWIIAAVGVFLLVVIGAALILYAPADRSEPAAASISPAEQTLSDGWILPSSSSDTTLSPAEPERNDSSIPVVNSKTESAAMQQNGPDTGKQETAPMQSTGTMTVISGTTNVYGITPAAKNSPTPATGTTTTIDLNTLKSSTPAVSDKSTVPQQTPSDAADAPVTTKSAVKVKTSSTATQKRTNSTVSYAKPATTIAKKTTAARTLSPSYWVQAASFTVKRSADTARKVLDDNKIPSEVFTYTDTKGKIYYRVRVGPYTTKSEAEYWQNRIVQIKEFSDTSSYITNSSAPLK